MLGLLLVVAVLVALSPETASTTGVRTAATRALASLRPRVLVPAGAARPLLAMVGLILATWSMGGFYQAFGPTIAEEQLGSSTALVATAVFSSFTLLAITGGPITAQLRPDVALRVGAVVYAAGVAQGAAQTGGMRSLLRRTVPADRAGLLSTVFLLNYTCAAVPGLVAGRLTTTFGMVQIAGGYAVLVVAGVVAVLALARPETTTTR